MQRHICKGTEGRIHKAYTGHQLEIGNGLKYGAREEQWWEINLEEPRALLHQPCAKSFFTKNCALLASHCLCLRLMFSSSATRLILLTPWFVFLQTVLLSSSSYISPSLSSFLTPGYRLSELRLLNYTVSCQGLYGAPN